MVEKLHKPSFFWDRGKTYKGAKKQHRTTVLIDNDSSPNDDWQFVLKNRLQPTVLLRTKIRELKENGNIEKKDAVSMVYHTKTVKELNIKLNRIIESLGKFLTPEQVQELLKEA